MSRERFVIFLTMLNRAQPIVRKLDIDGTSKYAYFLDYFLDYLVSVLFLTWIVLLDIDQSKLCSLFMLVRQTFPLIGQFLQRIYCKVNQA